MPVMAWAPRVQLREYQVDRWAFALWQMGDPEFHPR